MNLLRRKSKQKTAVPKVSNETIRDHNLPTNLSSEDLVSLNLVHARIASALSGVPDEKRCLLVFDIFFNSAHTLPSQVTLSTSILDAIKSDNTFLRLEDDLNDVVARFVPTDNLKYRDQMYRSNSLISHYRNVKDHEFYPKLSKPSEII